MALPDGAVDLEVVGITGVRLATFTASCQWTGIQVVERLKNQAPPPRGMDYSLISATGQAVLPEAALQLYVGDAKTATLTAYTVPQVVLAVRGVTGACQLPVSGDVIVATGGPLELGAETPPAVGQDDGPASSLWLWRLTATSGWSQSQAVLLVRTYCGDHDQLRKCFEDYADWLRKGNDSEYVSLWSVEEVRAADAAGLVEIPPPKLSRTWAHLHAHDERYVVVTYNTPDELGSCGMVVRLDTDSAEMVQLARVYDVWGSVTDPLDGRIFCTGCYAGWAVLQVAGTVYEPSPEALNQRQHRLLAALGPCLAFDPELRALVASKKVHPAERERERDEPRPSSFVFAAPPDSEALARLLERPGAREVEVRLDDHTPGDRSSLWRCVEVDAGEAVQAACPVGDTEPANTSDIELELLSLFLNSRGGQVCFLELSRQRKVISVPLLGPSSAKADVATTGRRLAGFAGFLGGEHPLVLLEHCKEKAEG